MCGRLVQELTSEEIAQLFDATVQVDDAGGHYNVAPTQQILGIEDHDHHRVETSYHWGLIPPWAESPRSVRG